MTIHSMYNKTEIYKKRTFLVGWEECSFVVSLEPLYMYATESCYMTSEIEKAIQGVEAGMLFLYIKRHHARSNLLYASKVGNILLKQKR
ncbi:hypothetical protein, partial [Bacillus mycoides]|uniref:hypothetical protein n=1 Tax=Bacillus mycoides TaxID=1405 RepID=UPI0019D65BDF